MSLSSIEYDIKDFFTETEAESRCKEYKKALHELDDEIEILDRNLTNLADQLVELQKVHNNPLSVSKGKYVMDFETKCSEVFSALSNKFIYYCENQSKVKEIREKVEERYKAWNKAVDTENSRKQDLTEEELGEV